MPLLFPVCIDFTREAKRLQHILYKNPIPLLRVVHEHMRHGSDQLSVLNNRAAAHALHDATRPCEKLLVRDF